MNLSKKILTAVTFLAVFSLQPAALFPQASDNSIKIKTDELPTLERLRSYDSVFKEFSHIVESNSKALKAKRQPEMLFFVHTMTQADKADLHWSDSQLISVASRCNISYDTIATLNKIENSTDDLINKTIIIPTVSGLFIKRYANDDSNALEILLRENYADQAQTATASFNIDGEEYVFLPNLRFTATERFYFLDSGLGLPLAKDSFWISSEFGKRKNPVNGEWKDHNGIDLAANEGTPVYAVKDGYAAYTIEKDATFGNYVILTHDTGKMSSVYAHLSSICVNQYAFVKKGDIIGYVGQTGMATGPHLHFEIRQGGIAQDPKTKLDLK